MPHRKVAIDWEKVVVVLDWTKVGDSQCNRELVGSARAKGALAEGNAKRRTLVIASDAVYWVGESTAALRKKLGANIVSP